jgi:hypothetical protein
MQPEALQRDAIRAGLVIGFRTAQASKFRDKKELGIH